jgi:hypothetical protein
VEEVLELGDVDRRLEFVMEFLSSSCLVFLELLRKFEQRNQRLRVEKEF